MRDRSDRFQVQTAPLSPKRPKRLGMYLIEAGLITPAQIDVALNDQKIMADMRFGEVLVARGWIKQQTLDYLFKKIIEPEQQAAKQERSQLTTPPSQANSAREHVTTPPNPSKTTNSGLDGLGNDRKSLPSVQKKDGGVSWVG